MSNQNTGRRYTPADYKPKDKLFRGFNESDLISDTGKLEINSISFPDFSCNWNRFSVAEDIRKRENAFPTDGCYTFSVEVSQFQNMATPCHDPVIDNYSHTEIRQLKPDESIDFEPPKYRKLKSFNWCQTKKTMYRQNIINNIAIEIEIGESV